MNSSPTLTHGYAVVSIRELNKMLKKAKADSRALHGKVVQHSTLVLRNIAIHYEHINSQGMVQLQLDV